MSGRFSPDQIPVISLNAFGKEKHAGFTITTKLLFSAIAAVCFGDLLMTLYQQVAPMNETREKQSSAGSVGIRNKGWI